MNARGRTPSGEAARADARPRRLPASPSVTARRDRPAGRLRLLRRLALPAILVALVLPALVLTACAGTRSSEVGSQAKDGGRPPTNGEVRLVVSRDFGATVLRDVIVPATAKLDVLRLLAENAEIDTGYGGRFINGIDGLKSSFSGTSSAGAADWFYWVDGVMADVGAGSWKLRGGESVWWDYHRWSDAMYIPQALAAFPRPYDTEPLPVAAVQDVAGLEMWAKANGLRLEARQSLDAQPRGGLVLATASQAAAAPWLTDLLTADKSGLALVKADPGTLTLLSPSGDRGPRAQAVALAAPNFDDPDRPLLVVLGQTARDIEAILLHLTPESLTARIGVALVDDKIIALPWGAT